MDAEAKRRIKEDIDASKPLEDELGRVFERAYDKENYNPSEDQVEVMEDEITTGSPRGFRQNATSDKRFIKIGDGYYEMRQIDRNHYYSPKKDQYFRQMADGRMKKIDDDAIK